MKKVEDGAVVESMADYPPPTFVTTGVASIDKITGGFPRGRLTEIYGKKSVGKTTLVLLMLSSLSKDHKVLFIDSENALNVSRLVDLGGNVTNIDFSTENILEDIGELILEKIGKYEAIILDSVASAVSRVEMASAIGDHNVGVKGKVMNSIFSRRLPGPLAKTTTALVVINQLRDSFSMYEPPYTPGGRAIEYASSLRLELTTNAVDKILDGKQQVGHKVNVKVTKSKVSAPYLTAKFTITY